ncbi:hypothetical protein RB8500 [Rhodopirellula baltica SH 1]|uniref:Uncharacterized protein n=1 Tax=Rhodopirellula baltica (strain DSM 10527 / NCIMB 13988 / SH1) TaxID=243090 RepID=Q7UFL1_RHOBA|nr:hypothetical protein RB8500 [Rhodopirellula baltica SH 1]
MRDMMENSKRLPWKSEPNLTETRRPIWGVFLSMSPTEALRRQTNLSDARAVGSLVVTCLLRGHRLQRWWWIRRLRASVGYGGLATNDLAKEVKAMKCRQVVGIGVSR